MSRSAGAISTVRRHFVKLIIGVLMTGGFIYLMSRQLEWQLVWTTIRQAHAGWLVLCVIPWITSIFVRIFRWWWMLRSHAPTLSLRACVWPYLFGAWLNLAIPLRVGDLARAFGFRARLKSPATRILGTLVLERVFDLLMVVLIFFAGLLGATAVDIIPPLFANVAGTVAGIALAGILTLLAGQKLFRRGVQKVAGHRRISESPLAKSIVEWLNHFFDGVSCLRGPGAWLLVFLLTAVMWICEAAIFILVAVSLGLENTFLAPIFSFSMASLATALPSAPGFVGTFDYFGALGLVAYNIDWSRATAFIFVCHVILVFPFALISLGYVFNKGKFPKGEPLRDLPAPEDHAGRGETEEGDVRG